MKVHFTDFTLFSPFFGAHLDEVSALVIDSGSWSTRAGYAGEDSPKLVFSSYYGYKEEEVSEEISTEPSNGDDKKSSEKQGSSNTTPEVDHEGDTKMENGDDNVEAVATPAVSSESTNPETTNGNRAKSQMSRLPRLRKSTIILAITAYTFLATRRFKAHVKGWYCRGLGRNGTIMGLHSR